MGSRANKIAPEHDPHSKLAVARPDVQLFIKHLEPSPESSSVNGDLQKPNTSNLTKAIFFFHGVGGSSDIWALQMVYFAEKGYHVIAPDLLGHGFSSTPDKASLYRFELLAKDMEYVFDQMYKDVNVIIGHSYGTSFAAYLARTRSSKVDKLVLMNGGAPVSLAPQRGILSLPSPFLSCLKPILTRQFNQSAFHKKSKHLPHRERAFDVPIYVLRHTMKGQVWDDGDETFHSLISQSTLLLHGEADRLESVDNTRDMHKILERSQIYVIPDASHMIMMEQPEVVNKLIDKFLHSELPISIGHAPHADVVHTSSSHMTKSQPNIRRATLSG